MCFLQVKQLNLYNYKYTDDFCDYSNIQEPEQFGVLAQEVRLRNLTIGARNSLLRDQQPFSHFNNHLYNEQVWNPKERSEK